MTAYTYKITGIVPETSDKRRLNNQGKRVAIARPVMINGEDVHNWIIFAMSDAVHDCQSFSWKETFGFCKTMDSTADGAKVCVKDAISGIDTEKIYSYPLDRCFVRTREDNPSSGTGTFTVRNNAINKIGLGLTMANASHDGSNTMKPIAIVQCDKGDAVNIQPKEQMAIFTIMQGKGSGSFYIVQGNETIIDLNPSHRNIVVEYQDGKWVETTKDEEHYC